MIDKVYNNGSNGVCLKIITSDEESSEEFEVIEFHADGAAWHKKFVGDKEISRENILWRLEL